MNYFDPYPLCVDETVSAAWKSQLTAVENTPWLARTLTERASELFPRFVTGYTELRALPRAARRSIQRRLARSRDVLDRSPEWLERREGRSLQYKLARSLTGAALLLALGQSVQAATIIVTTNNPSISDGDGKCSLIEAIINANADNDLSNGDCTAGSGADTIVLPAKKAITLRTPYTNYQGDTGLPIITSEITIEGNGAKIARKKGAVDFRLIAVSSVGNLDLQNTIITGGKSDKGGVVFNAGRLTASNSTLSMSTAFRGGGLYNAVSGNLTLDNCSVSKNTAYFSGGGLYNSGGNVTVEHSRVSMNRTSPSLGAGIGEKFTAPFGLGTIMIINSTISRNTGPTSVFLSSIASFIENSTISDNRGVGVYVFRGTGAIENSTISGNLGGGVMNRPSTLTITNSTISNNGAAFLVSRGVENSGSLLLKRTLISGNKGSSGAEIGNIGTVVADDFNVFGTNGSAGISGFTPGPTDIVPGVGVTVKKILGPLKNNGGPTMTHALVPGSPAIDAAPVGPDCPVTGQRGILRPQGAGCDIGAFEK